MLDGCGVLTEEKGNGGCGVVAAEPVVEVCMRFWPVERDGDLRDWALGVGNGWEEGLEEGGADMT